MQKNSKNNNLKPSNTLDSFVVGKSNQFAFNAVQNINKNDFVIIYGKSATGKTHLLNGIGNLFIAKNQNVVYSTAEMFLDDMVNNIRHNTMGDFSKKYRSCDLLLIDDIQFFSSKDGIQEEFFYTIEYLKSNGKKIILTSNKHPKDLYGFEDRLKNCLLSAISIKMKLPKKNIMRIIAKQENNNQRTALDNATIDFIVNGSKKNINQMKGMITKLNTYSSLYNIGVDLKSAKKILKNDVITKNKKNV